jgi:hypothetical protein
MLDWAAKYDDVYDLVMREIITSLKKTIYISFEIKCRRDENVGFNYVDFTLRHVECFDFLEIRYTCVPEPIRVDSPRGNNHKDKTDIKDIPFSMFPLEHFYKFDDEPIIGWSNRNYSNSNLKRYAGSKCILDLRKAKEYNLLYAIKQHEKKDIETIKIDVDIAGAYYLYKKLEDERIELEWQKENPGKSRWMMDMYEYAKSLESLCCEQSE